MTKYFNNIQNIDELDLLITEEELGTLELNYIAARHAGMVNPLLDMSIKLLCRNQILEEEKIKSESKRLKAIEYIKSKKGYKNFNYYNDLLKILE